MKRTRAKTRWNLLIILLVAVALSYAGYRYLFSSVQPEYPGIFAISTPLEYGDTTLRGELRKDAPAGQKGSFILVLSDGRPIILDSQGLDALLNLPVTVSGYLSPSIDGIAPATMKVTSIETTQL